MKLDYDFMKKILYTMEDYPKHQINVIKLLTLLKITNKEGEILSEGLFEKFIGHIKLLGDDKYIETSDKRGNYGFNMNINGEYIISDPWYRITAKGYEFIDILKNDHAFSKIKNFAITEVDNIKLVHKILN